MDMAAKGRPRYVGVEAVVIRKDGTREDLGVVAEYHRNPLRRVWSQIRGVGRARVS